MSFRRATPADVAAVRALTRAAYTKWIPVIGREPLPMTADYALAVERHRVELLEVDGELAGLVELVPEPGVLLIENVAVAPERQGDGHGRTLLTRAEEVAAEWGLPRLRLYTNAMFTANIQLYQHLGYVLEREEAYRGGRVVHLGKARARTS